MSDDDLLQHCHWYISPHRFDGRLEQLQLSMERHGVGVVESLDALQALDSSQLKLQAIAWSEDISRRMAVINNRIVREGETVDGFSITKIRQDDVIVTDGSASWKLEFSLKQ